MLTWNYGNFIDKIITLLLTAAILFFIVKAYAAAFRRSTPKPAEKDCPYCCKSVPIRATRCPNCTSELEGYISDDDEEDEESRFLGIVPLNIPKIFKRISVDNIDEPIFPDFKKKTNADKDHNDYGKVKDAKDAKDPGDTAKEAKDPVKEAKEAKDEKDEKGFKRYDDVLVILEKEAKDPGKMV